MSEGNEGKVYAFFTLVGVALTFVGCGTGSTEGVQRGVVRALGAGIMPSPSTRIKKPERPRHPPQQRRWGTAETACGLSLGGGRFRVTGVR